VSADAQAGDSSAGHRLNAKQTAVMLAVMVFLTVLEVVVSMSHGPSAIVTAALFVLAIVQAVYFLLVAMGLNHETRIMNRWVAGLLCIGIFYSLVLINEAAWRSQFWRVLRGG
jgi:heme/copper-type cytochrome/quinol oxidase subunit 4